MNKNIVRLFLIFLIIIIFIGCEERNYSNQSSKETEDQESGLENISRGQAAVVGEAEEEKQDKKVKVTLIIKNGEEVKKINYKIVKETSLLEAMKQISGEKNFSFEYKESNMGAFIEAIDGVKNDIKNNYFWMYKINDKEADTGVSQYLIQGGENIEWEYRDITETVQ